MDSFWLSSEDNSLADDLSRDREAKCLEDAVSTGFWHPSVCAMRHPDSGSVRALPERRGVLHSSQFGKRKSEGVDGKEPVQS